MNSNSQVIFQMENGVIGQNILNVVKFVEVANKPGSENVIRLNFQVEVISVKDQAMKPQPAILTLAQSKVKFLETVTYFSCLHQNSFLDQMI